MINYKIVIIVATVKGGKNAFKNDFIKSFQHLTEDTFVSLSQLGGG